MSRGKEAYSPRLVRSPPRCGINCWDKVGRWTDRHIEARWYRVWMDEKEQHCWWIPARMVRAGEVAALSEAEKDRPDAVPAVRRLFADLARTKAMLVEDAVICAWPQELAE